MRYYKTPVRIIKLKQSDNTKSWWEQGATEFFHAFSYFVGGQCTTVDHSRKQFGSFVLFCFFIKLNIESPQMQQSHSLVFTRVKLKLMFIQNPKHRCLQ